jgi:hypothetical protein
MAVIGLYRVVGSLPVLRWPFIGGLIAVLCDLCDLFLMDWLGGVANYQSFDKYLDQVYMLTFLIVVLAWTGLPRAVGVALYGYRMAGFVAFELTGARVILLAFPNFFEVWFLFIAGLAFFHVERPASKRWVWLVAIFLAAAKAVQEYVLHYAKLLDGFTAVQAVHAIWHWLTGPL